LEIYPGLIAFHYNWTKPYNEYLQLDKIYRGFGRFSNCGNDQIADDFPIAQESMKPCLNRGKLLNIYNWTLFHDYFAYREDGSYAGSDALERLGYFRDFKNFKAAAIAECELTPLFDFTNTHQISLIYHVDLQNLKV
jgi:hypothetical protein